MSTTPNPAAAQTFMVVAIVRDDTNFAEFAALRDDEQKQLEGTALGEQPADAALTSAWTRAEAA
jgi:hypothetical protein